VAFVGHRRLADDRRLGILDRPDREEFVRERRDDGRHAVALAATSSRPTLGGALPNRNRTSSVISSRAACVFAGVERGEQFADRLFISGHRLALRAGGWGFGGYGFVDGADCFDLHAHVCWPGVSCVHVSQRTKEYVSGQLISWQLS